MTAAMIRERYALVLDQIDTACACAGRERESVRLLAVSKFQPVSVIAALAEAGHDYFGENYVQEALEKRSLLADSPFGAALRWDMIGHVQTRKAQLVAGGFELVHTLDSLKLAMAFEKSLVRDDISQDALIEVNIGGEPQKAGVMPENLRELAVGIMEAAPHVCLRGLMCLPPVFDAGEAARPYFSRLRLLRDELEIELGISMPELSMGMSGDFAVAIQEGATIVRIGSAIFGPRPPKVPA